MRRAPRPGIAGATQNITARGNAGVGIFSDDYDRYVYLALVARAVRLMEVGIFAWLVHAPENYPWSSYRFYLAADARAQQTLVDVWPVLKLFNEDPVASRAAYERFVREGISL